MVSLLAYVRPLTFSFVKNLKSQVRRLRTRVCAACVALGIGKPVRSGVWAVPSFLGAV